MTLELVVDNSPGAVLNKSWGQNPQKAIVLIEDGEGNLQARWSQMDKAETLFLAKQGIALLLKGIE